MDQCFHTRSYKKTLEEAAVVGIATVGAFELCKWLSPRTPGLQLFAAATINYTMTKHLQSKSISKQYVFIGSPEETPDYSSKCTKLCSSESQQRQQLEGLFCTSAQQSQEEHLDVLIWQN